jgi:hypothetical protein
MKQMAVLAFMLTSPGKRLLSAAMSNIQPKRTAQPIRAIARLAFLEKDCSEAIGVGVWEISSMWDKPSICFTREIVFSPAVTITKNGAQ